MKSFHQFLTEAENSIPLDGLAIKGSIFSFFIISNKQTN